MKVDEISRVGIAFTDDGDLMPLVAHKDNRGNFQVFRSNGSFGVELLLGFEEFELQAVNDDVIDSLVDHINDPAFSDAKGIIKIEDGLIFVTDFECGECDYIKGALIPENRVAIESNIVCGELDDAGDADYVSEVLEYFE